MTNHELPPEIKSASLVIDGLNRIGEIRYPPVSSSAKRVLRMVNNELFFIDVIDPKKELIQPWAVDFQVRKSPLDQEPEGALVVDPIRVASMRSDVLDAELVRTVSVAAQYPDLGYCRPLREVYSEALMLQRQWLEAMKISGTIFDPRSQDLEVIIRNLIGDQAYYSDFGFGDWKGAISTLQIDEEKESCDDGLDRLKILRELYSDRDEFILARVRNSPHHLDDRQLHPIVRAQLEKELPEKRALKNAVHAASESLKDFE